MAGLPPVILRGRVLGYTTKGANPETGQPSNYGNMHVLAGFESVAVSYPRTWGAALAPEGAQVEVECTIWVGSSGRMRDQHSKVEPVRRARQS